MASYQDLPQTVKIKTTSSSVKIPNSVSLKELLSDAKEENTVTESLPSDPFTNNQLNDLWLKYAYSIKNADLDFFTTLNACLPVLKDNFQAEIVITSSFQMLEFVKTKQQLLDYLRKNLNNYQLNIVEILNIAEAKEFVVTPNEKYKKLVEKNAFLDQLRTKLDLGF